LKPNTLFLFPFISFERSLRIITISIV
jgi:hypothetical protein